jgi:hypothetical protein
MGSSRGNRIIAVIRAREFPRQPGRIFLSPTFCKFFSIIHLFPDFLAMVVVIGQGGIHVGQCDLRKLGDYFVRREPLVLVPNRNVLDADPMTCNAGLAAANAGRDFDMFVKNRHNHLLHLPGKAIFVCAYCTTFAIP